MSDIKDEIQERLALGLTLTAKQAGHLLEVIECQVAHINRLTAENSELSAKLRYYDSVQCMDIWRKIPCDHGTIPTRPLDPEKVAAVLQDRAMLIEVAEAAAAYMQTPHFPLDEAAHHLLDKLKVTGFWKNPEPEVEVEDE